MQNEVHNELLYSGTIRYSGSGQHTWVNTKLWRTKEGRFVGSYRSQAEDGIYSGVLRELESVGDRTDFSWKDRYGTGTLEVTFSEDGGSFSGKYTNENHDDYTGSWSGERN